MLTQQYPAVTPTVINMALQSVFYDEGKAQKVLDNMVESDKQTKKALEMATPKTTRLFYIIIFLLFLTIV